MLPEVLRMRQWYRSGFPKGELNKFQIRKIMMQEKFPEKRRSTSFFFFFRRKEEPLPCLIHSSIASFESEQLTAADKLNEFEFSKVEEDWEEDEEEAAAKLSKTEPLFVCFFSVGNASNSSESKTARRKCKSEDGNGVHFEMRSNDSMKIAAKVKSWRRSANSASLFA